MVYEGVVTFFDVLSVQAGGKSNDSSLFCGRGGSGLDSSRNVSSF